MRTERIFTQRVAMLVPTFEKWGELWLRMKDLGYKCQEISDSSFPWVAITDTGIKGDSITEFAYVSTAHKLPHEYIEIDEWNPDLFVAIAAMSEGDDYHKGEPLRFTELMPENFGDRNRIVFFDSIIGEVDDVSGNIKFLDPMAGDYFNCRPKSIRKATKEEVLDYYKEIDKAVDQIIEEVKESFETGAVLGRADKTNEPDFVTDYKEQSFFEENIAKELSGQTETNWIKEMEEGDNAEQILDQARTFADSSKLSTVLTDWIPQPDEEVWVWCEGGIERVKRNFAFFTPDNKIMAYSGSLTEYATHVYCQRYDFIAKIDAPVVISPSDVIETFSSIYGVPTSLIQIGQTDEP